jgi:hypothetical protein
MSVTIEKKNVLVVVVSILQKFYKSQEIFKLSSFFYSESFKKLCRFLYYA